MTKLKKSGKVAGVMCVNGNASQLGTHFVLSISHRLAESAILHDFLAVLHGTLKRKERPYIIMLENATKQTGAGGTDLPQLQAYIYSENPQGTVLI